MLGPRPLFALATAMLVAATTPSCSAPSLEVYDETLYDYLKYATPESLDAHVGTLEDLVERSDARGKTPPPGICAEYGYYLSLRGEPERGYALLLREKELYPESERFVNVLIRIASGEEPIDEAPGDEPPGDEARDGGAPEPDAGDGEDADRDAGDEEGGPR